MCPSQIEFAYRNTYPSSINNYHLGTTQHSLEKYAVSVVHENIQYVYCVDKDFFKNLFMTKLRLSVGGNVGRN